MKPFTLTVVRVTGNHLAVTDAVTVAVRRLVGVNLAILIISLHATAGICVRSSKYLDNSLRDRPALLVAFLGRAAFCGS